MKGLIGILFVCCTMFCFLSCKEIIEFDENSVRDTLVVSSVIEDGKPVEVRLSKTINRFDGSTVEYYEDKTITLYENGNKIGNLDHIARGRYALEKYNVRSDNDYLIEIFDNNNKMASAETNVPVPLEITGIDTVSQIVDGKRRIKINLRFNEPGTVENFYRIEIEEVIAVPYIKANKEPSARFITVPGEVKLDNNWLLRGMGFYNEHEKFHDWAGNRFYIFSDRYIQGKEISLELDMEYFRSDSILGSIRRFHLQNISSDYFYYLRSVMQQTKTSSNPFNEPVQIHSNIKGGVGIFGGFSQTVDSVIQINHALIDSLFPDIELPPGLEPVNNSSAAFVGSRYLQDF